MLATRIKQKDGVFYFASFKARDVLNRVKFTTRFYFEGETIEAEPVMDDPIARFIGSVERSEKAFQRMLSRRKVREIVNFYESAETQPMIPGSVLLFSEDVLHFRPLGQFESVGNLEEPRSGFLIIDGQHRLAGLHFYGSKNEELLDQIEVPCVIFDGKTAEFAAEMFVIINSTQTRINKSHLVDLLDRIGRYDEKTRLAASTVRKLYEEPSSPLQYKINRLGGRSRQEKWILQAELFNELKKLIEEHERLFMKDLRGKADRAFELIADFLKAARTVMDRVWGNNDRYKFTTSVTLKALIRVLGELIESSDAVERWMESPGPKHFEKRISGWAELKDDFRTEGFYERFPAKGQLERVRVIEQRLLRETRTG
ncbi:MAG TPA: DGQHR domain-containing protein [Terriglobia bacterium]|nr:DGQHR domain-containing protein [Terriglobia bacterium]